MAIRILTAALAITLLRDRRSRTRRDVSVVRPQSTATMDSGYPSIAQAAVAGAAEQLMEETMARYDPSHDAYHGKFRLMSGRRAWG